MQSLEQVFESVRNFRNVVNNVEGYDDIKNKNLTMDESLLGMMITISKAVKAKGNLDAQSKNILYAVNIGLEMLQQLDMEI